MFECTLVMDTTFLQLIEHVSKKPFEEHCLNDQSIVEYEHIVEIVKCNDFQEMKTNAY